MLKKIKVEITFVDHEGDDICTAGAEYKDLSKNNENIVRDITTDIAQDMMSLLVIVKDVCAEYDKEHKGK